MEPTPASLNPSPRAPYGRRSEQKQDLLPIQFNGQVSLAPYQGEDYYALPPLKPGHYKWLIVQYFFVGGISGSAQILAAVADLAGDEEDRVIVRHGRYIALGGAVLSPIFLIADLHMPSRWYNMLRIYRGTSPMSFGAWVLTAFGTLSGLAAVAQFIEDRTAGRYGRLLGRIFGLPAAAAGGVVSYYTAPLLSATSVPLWASVNRLLPPMFSASAAANASSALSLSLQAVDAPQAPRERLETFETIMETAEMATATAMSRKWQREGLKGPLTEQPLSSVYHLGAIGLGVVVPLAIHGVQMLTGRKSRTASTVAAVSTLVGGFCLRAAMVFGGRKSAERPQDYYRYTQPGNSNGRAVDVEERPPVGAPVGEGRP